MSHHMISDPSDARACISGRTRSLK
jgi:hypothetical protein